MALSGASVTNLPTHRLINMIHEFEVHAPAGQVLTLRTVASQDASLGNISDVPVAPHDNVRGSWPTSTIQVENPTAFDCTVPNDEQYHDVKQFSIGGSGSIEKQTYLHWAGDTYGSGDNGGLFGVTLKYKVYTISPTQENNVRFQLRARNCSQQSPQFGGAAGGPLETTYTAYQIPQIKPAGTSTSAQGGSAKAGATGVPRPLTVQMGVAGGSCLSVALTFQSVDVVGP